MVEPLILEGGENNYEGIIVTACVNGNVQKGVVENHNRAHKLVLPGLLRMKGELRRSSGTWAYTRMGLGRMPLV